MSLGLQSNSDAHAGTYYVKLEVKFSKLTALKFLNYDNILVQLDKGCHEDTVTAAKWTTNNLDTIPNFSHKIGTDTNVMEYAPTVATGFSYCSVTFWLQKKDGTGAW